MQAERLVREDELEVLTWLVERFEELHFPYPVALRLAREHVTWHDADDLIQAGCDPSTAARILLKGDS